MSGLLVIAGDTPVSAMIWHVSYPDGRVRRVTNDLNAYRAMGLTQGGKQLTTVQVQGLVNLWSSLKVTPQKKSDCPREM